MLSTTSPCSSTGSYGAREERAQRAPRAVASPRRLSTSASSASRNVAGSEWGSEKQRLPASVPTVRTRTFATWRSIDASAGSRSSTSGDRSIWRCVAVAPDHEHVAVLADARELVDRLRVDEVLERGEAELREQQQLGAAAVQQRLLAVLVEERGCLLDRSRPVQLEGRERHACVAAAGCASTSSAASTPAPTETDAPRSLSVRPSAERPAIGYIERAVGPMWPMRTRLPAPCPPEIITP